MAFFPLEFHRRQEEIVQQAQIGIHRVHRREGGRRIVADVAHQLADMRPVLLLDVRVVVFLVGPAPRELHGVGPAVLQ